MSNYNALSLSTNRRGLELGLGLNARSNDVARFDSIPSAFTSAHAHPRQQHQRSAPAKGSAWSAAWPAIPPAIIAVRPESTERGVEAHPVDTTRVAARQTGVCRTDSKSKSLNFRKPLTFEFLASMPRMDRDRRMRAAWPCDRTRLDALRI